MLIVLPHQVPKYPCSLFFSFFFFFGSTYKFNPKTDGVVGPMKLHQFSRYRQSNHREPVTEKYITDFYKCLYEHNNNNNRNNKGHLKMKVIWFMIILQLIIQICIIFSPVNRWNLQIDNQNHITLFGHYLAYGKKLDFLQIGVKNV